MRYWLLFVFSSLFLFQHAYAQNSTTNDEKALFYLRDTKNVEGQWKAGLMYLGEAVGTTLLALWLAHPAAVTAAATAAAAKASEATQPAVVVAVEQGARSILETYSGAHVRLAAAGLVGWVSQQLWFQMFFFFNEAWRSHIVNPPSDELTGVKHSEL